jgi:hypothetical protein
MLASDGALVRERWPDRYTGPDRTTPGAAG